MARHWAQAVKRAPKAQRTNAAGVVFDSAAEMNRWAQLRMLERAGEIRDLQRQVRFPLILADGTPVKIRSPGYPNGRNANYHADFVYFDRNGAKVVEEYKGHDDTASRLRRAIVEAIYKITITMTGPAARRAA